MPIGEPEIRAVVAAIRAAASTIEGGVLIASAAVSGSILFHAFWTTIWSH